MKKSILAVVFSAVILFFWGYISWTVLPWHNMVSQTFTDEAAVAQVLQANASQKGIYYLPYKHEDHEAGQTAAFVNVLPQGFDMNMSKLMGIGFVIQLLASLFVVLLLSQTTKLGYWNKVMFVALIGLTIGFVNQALLWNWFGFPLIYAVVQIFDSLVAWSLAGLAMAKLVEGKSTT